MSVNQTTLKGSSLIVHSPLSNVVNVASVPLRSPFRYPGGKTWLIPAIRRWLTSLHPKPSELIEPFAGGGIIGLTAAFEGLTKHVTLVELDADVASVWKTILKEQDAKWLARKIISFNFSKKAVADILRNSPSNQRERAFITLLKNRINRGGILAPGAGVSKLGENGKGMASRWYPNTLQKRILDIALRRDSIDFLHEDGMSVLRGNAHRRDVVFFIDPPYTAAGKKAGLRLYRHNQVDHAALFEAAQNIKGDFLMTYDDSDEIRSMATHHGFETLSVPMKNTHHAIMTELLVGKDLSWAKTRTLPLTA